MATHIGNKLVGVSLTVLVLAVLLTSIAFQHDKRDSSRSSNDTTTLTLQEAMGKDALRKVIESMRRSGHTSMALFLETHPVALGGHVRRHGIAIFAPSDKAVAGVEGDLSPVLLRHVITSCGFFRDNVGFIRTFSPGFVITVKWSHQSGCHVINSQVPFPLGPIYMDLHNHVVVYPMQQIIPPLTQEELIKS